MSLASNLRDRMVCSAHREAAGFPIDADQVLAALTMGIGRPGRLGRSLIYGAKGVISVARHHRELRGETAIAAAMLAAARTGCDIRDFRSMRRNHIGSLEYLHRIVPRPRRREYREWNNCAVGAGLVNDKWNCNRVLTEGGLPAPTAVSRSKSEAEDGEWPVHVAAGPSGGLGDVVAAGQAKRADGQVA